jgi:hypothetical protein
MSNTFRALELLFSALLNAEKRRFFEHVKTIVAPSDEHHREENCVPMRSPVDDEPKPNANGAPERMRVWVFSDRLCVEDYDVEDCEADLENHDKDTPNVDPPQRPKNDKDSISGLEADGALGRLWEEDCDDED